MEQVLRIAKIKRPEFLAKTLKSATKEVLGSCVSMGVTVDSKDPREIQKEIDSGIHDQIFGKDEG
jgi:large subunit ribosomal protein L11